MLPDFLRPQSTCTTKQLARSQQQFAWTMLPCGEAQESVGVQLLRACVAAWDSPKWRIGDLPLYHR